MGDIGDAVGAMIRMFFFLGILIGVGGVGAIWLIVKAWQAWGPTITW